MRAFCTGLYREPAHQNISSIVTKTKTRLSQNRSLLLCYLYFCHCFVQVRSQRKALRVIIQEIPRRHFICIKQVNKTIWTTDLAPATAWFPQQTYKTTWFSRKIFSQDPANQDVRPSHIATGITRNFPSKNTTKTASVQEQVINKREGPPWHRDPPRKTPVLNGNWSKN